MKNISVSLKVIIADDHQLFVEGIVSILSNVKEIRIIDKATNGEELLKKLEHVIPDVVILDIKMPGINGMEVLKQIKERYPAIRVIMLSTFADQQTIHTCLQNGADGYLFKNASLLELKDAILGITGKKHAFDQLLKLPNNENAKLEYYSNTFQITKRELAIMDMIKEGYTSQKISELLFRSVFTIQTHRKNIMQKLNLKSVAALTRFLHENDF